MRANHFKFLLPGISFLFLTVNSFAVTDKKEKHKSIADCVDSKKLDVKILGLGGYQGECIGIDMNNVTPDTLFVKVEAGRRFVSEDTTEQDIFVVKEIMLALLPMEKRMVKAFGFCCEATMHAPKQNSKFSVGKMAPDDWVSLAKFMHKNNFEEQAMQSAVWVMSNNHQISSVTCKTQKQTDLLRAALAKLKHIEVPWYTLRYKEVEGQLFSDRPMRMYGPVDFTLREPAIITIQVRNEAGDIVAVPLPGSEYMNGENIYTIDIDVNNLPKGKYTVYVFAGGTMRVNKKEFVL